jgi:hypothetical protein
MKPGMRVTVGGRSGVVKALRPGDSVDVQFDGEEFTSRHGSDHVKPLRENGRRSRNPGPRGGLTARERESLGSDVFALPGRRFPINDRRHAVIAMQYLLRGFVAEGDAPKVLAAIKKRYPPTDPRNREIWSFYSRHSERLPALQNPAGDVYDPAKEQFRAVVQGVYESQVRKALGLPSSTDFVDARGRRLDASLDQDEKKRLLSSAYAIATRQGQKHGWLVPGTQTPTAKGMLRSAERLSEAEHAEANRQDYERTLGAVRGSGYYRVVAQIVQGQTRYVVQPRPPANLVKIPEYRLNESSALEDAKKAEAARSAAPFDVKARSNPYYAQELPDRTEVFDIRDEPESTLVMEGDTLQSIARRLGVTPQILGRYGIVEKPVIEDDGSQGWDEMRPGRLIQRTKVDEQFYQDAEGNAKVRQVTSLLPSRLPTDRRLWDTPSFLRIDSRLVGYRITKQNLIAQFEQSEGAGLTRHATPQARDAELPTLEENIRLRRAKRAQEAAARREAEEAEAARRRPAAAELPAERPLEPSMTRAQLEASLAVARSDSRYQRYLQAQRVADEAGSVQAKGRKLAVASTSEAAKEAYERVDPAVLARISYLEDQLARLVMMESAALRPSTAAPPTQTTRRPLPEAFQTALSLAAPRKVIVSYVKLSGLKQPAVQVRVFYVPIRYGEDPALREKLIQRLDNAAYGALGEDNAGNTAVFQRDVVVFPSVEDAEAALNSRLNVMRSKGSEALASSIEMYEKAIEKMKEERDNDRLTYFTGPIAEFTARPALSPRAPSDISGYRFTTGAPAAAQMAALGEAVGTIQYELMMRRCIESEMAALGPEPTLDQRIDVTEKCRRAATLAFGKSRASTDAVTGVGNELRTLLLTDPQELRRRYLDTALRQPDFSQRIQEVILRLNRPKDTPKEAERKRALRKDRPTGPVWDLEYITVIPRPQRGQPAVQEEPRVEERYVLYLPRTLRTITKLKRDQGLLRFSDAPSRKYVRFRGGAPSVGSATAPSEIYQKQDDAVAEAEKELSAARQSGDIKAQVAALNKIANVRRAQKSYKDAVAGTVDPFLVASYEEIPAAKKLNIFNFRKPPSGEKFKSAMSVLGIAGRAPERPTEEGTTKSEFLDPADSWVEDLSFRGEKSKLRRFDTASGKTVSLDPRTGMVKFYTTNPMLAYLTILLWNTPELFTGTTIILPSTEVMTGRDISVGDEEGDTFTTVSVAPITEDNPKFDPMKVYEDLEAAVIRAKGVFAAAVLSGDMEEAAAAWVKLVGVDRPGMPRMSGLIEAVQRIRTDAEPIPSAKEVFGEWQYEKDFRTAAEELNEAVNVARRKFSEGTMSQSDYAAAIEEATALARAQKDVMRRRNEKTNVLTSLMQANIANALMFGEGAQMRVLAAWQDVAEAVRTAAKNRSEELRRELQAARDIGYPRQITENLQAEFDAIQMLFQSRAKANR